MQYILLAPILRKLRLESLAKLSHYVVDKQAGVQDDPPSKDINKK